MKSRKKQKQMITPTFESSFFKEIEFLIDSANKELVRIQADKDYSDTEKRTKSKNVSTKLERYEQILRKQKFVFLGCDALMQLFADVEQDAKERKGNISPLTLVKLRRLAGTMEKEYSKLQEEK